MDEPVIDEYRLVDSIVRNTQHVVSPHGEKIAVVIKTYSGVSVSSLNSKLPQKLEHELRSDLVYELS